MKSQTLNLNGFPSMDARPDASDGMVLFRVLSCMYAQDGRYIFDWLTHAPMHTHTHTHTHTQIIGWRDTALRLVLYLTDNFYHIAGDGRVRRHYDHSRSSDYHCNGMEVYCWSADTHGGFSIGSER